jgi:hypothetical protein
MLHPSLKFPLSSILLFPYLLLAADILASIKAS